jgi:glycosyltransferase involved in cell wall biosynthesis
MAQLAKQNGETEIATFEASEAAKYHCFGERFFPAFDRVLVCSNADATRLSAQFPKASFGAVPNGYAPPPAILPHIPCREGPLRLLFVGTLGCYANSDAALFLCREVLPVLRRMARRQVEIDLAGSGASDALIGIAADPGIRVHGFVDALGSLYSSADVAVIPLRAGGGTRIKILEAFAHGVPVLSTSIGAEGLDVIEGEHLLLADDAETFARECLRMKENPGLCARLAGRATSLLAFSYGPARVDAALAGIYAEAKSRNLSGSA